MNLRAFHRPLPVLLLLLPCVPTLASAAPVDASAENRYDPTHKARFQAADIDQSRGLSREEIAASLPRVLLRHFAEIDTDGSGELSPEELVAMREREAALREARRRERLDELRGGSY